MTKRKANKLLILSRNCPRYKELIERADLHDLEIETAVSPEDVREKAEQYNILLSSPGLASEILPAMTSLQWMQSTWAGVNQLVSDGCRKDYLLTGVKGVFGPIMSEYVFCYILMHARNALKCYELQKARQWEMPMPGLLRGKKIGIMGVGSIGSAVAGTAKHFGMTVYGYARRATTRPGIDTMFGPDQVLEFVSGLDYLVTIMPQTPDTRHLIGKTVFKAMKEEAILINVGRGALVDEDALVEALKSKEIGGAVLDVFQQEPLPESHPLWSAPGAIITSHKAALTYPEDIVPIFIENYQRFTAGNELCFLVDFDRGY